MNKNKVTSTADEARQLFSDGLYCAESVLSAIAKSRGIDSELLPRVATAFCSGMARTCGDCGALTGAMMGLSLCYGRGEADESVDKLYGLTQHLISDFEQEFGSRHCHELLGCDLGTEEGKTLFHEKGLRTRCEGYTHRATELASQLILDNKTSTSINNT